MDTIVEISEQRQLVTYILATYNQEDVVAEALKSALAQTYQPLEIIISDDCSTDETYDIIKKIVKTYDGPHSIKLNQNSQNLGIGHHWDYISRTAQGELIIHGAGDDISLQNRTEILVNAWKSYAPRPTMISSDGTKISYDGRSLGPHIGPRFPYKMAIQREVVLGNLDLNIVPRCGFSLAIDRKLYDVFDPIEHRLWSEDDILKRRALLLNGIAYISDELLLYRDNGLSKGAQKTKEAYLHLFREQTISRISVIKISQSDLNKTSYAHNQTFIKSFDLQHQNACQRLQMIDAKFISSFWSLICLVLYLEHTEGLSRRECLNFFLVRWFPNLFFSLRRQKNYLASLRSNT